MKTVKIILAVLCAPGFAAAAELDTATSSFLGNLRPEAAAPAPAQAEVYAADVETLTDNFAICGRDAVLAHPKTQQEYDAFYTRYSKLLEKAGLKITSAQFNPVAGSMIKYSSPSGLALREFIADEFQYDAASATSTVKDLDATRSAMEKAGLVVVENYLLKTTYVRPTYIIYYLTRAEAKPEHEIRVRVFNKGDDIDYPMLEKAGVNIFRKDTSWLMGYIGPEISMVYRIGESEEAMREKVHTVIAGLTANGCKIIGWSISPIEPFDKYKFILYIYFYL